MRKVIFFLFFFSAVHLSVQASTFPDNLFKDIEEGCAKANPKRLAAIKRYVGELKAAETLAEQKPILFKLLQKYWNNFPDENGEGGNMVVASFLKIDHLLAQALYIESLWDEYSRVEIDEFRNAIDGAMRIEFLNFNFLYHFAYPFEVKEFLLEDEIEGSRLKSLMKRLSSLKIYEKNPFSPLSSCKK